MIQRVKFILSPSEKGIDDAGYTYLPPLSLGILAGYLGEKNYDISLHDLNMELPKIYKGMEEQFQFLYDKKRVLDYLNGAEDNEIEQYAIEILQNVDTENCDIVGISCGADFSFFQLHSAFILAKYIKEKYGLPILLGGNNVTYLKQFEQTFDDLIKTIMSQFPYIMKGPGEYVIDELIQVLNGTSDKDIYQLDGMMYLEDGKLVCNKEHKPIIVRPDWKNLDMSYYCLKVNPALEDTSKENVAEAENRIHVFKWPFYLTHYVSLVRKKVKNKVFEDKLVIPYIFNFHCPYACAFCSESAAERKEVIMGDVDKVIEDLGVMTEKYNTNYFYFLNNAINASASFLDAFCKRIIENNIKIVWSDCARFNGMTYERLKMMKEAGCVKLVFGFETASQKLIDLVEKRIDLTQGEQVMRWCKELGIWVDLEVIVGLPQEQETDFLDTVAFVNKNREYINYMTINEFFVVPNSKIGRNPEKYDICLEKTIIHYETLLERSWRYFKNEKGRPSGNFKIFKFNEIGGRNYVEIMKDTKKHIHYMNKLQNKEFTEVESVFRLIEKRAMSGS